MNSKLLLSALLALVAVEISQIESSSSAPNNKEISKTSSEKNEPVQLMNTSAYDAWTNIHVRRNAYGNTELNWKINGPVRTESFLIQRSENGKHFKTIGRRTPSQNQFEYAFEDAGYRKPAVYRIIEIENDGNINYSNNVKLKLYSRSHR